MVEFAEIFNFLQLYSCVYIYMFGLVFFTFYFFFFFLYIPYQGCDTDPELDHHLVLNKYGFIDFNGVKEGYVR